MILICDFELDIVNTYTFKPKMNFLGQCLQTLEPEQTDRQTDATERSTTPHSHHVTMTLR